MERRFRIILRIERLRQSVACFAASVLGRASNSNTLRPFPWSPSRPIACHGLSPSAKSRALPSGFRPHSLRLSRFPPPWRQKTELGHALFLFPHPGLVRATRGGGHPCERKGGEVTYRSRMEGCEPRDRAPPVNSRSLLLINRGREVVMASEERLIPASGWGSRGVSRSVPAGRNQGRSRPGGLATVIDRVSG